MSSSSRLARLHYGPSSYRVVVAGDYVLCAATGVPIGLDELRYWSAARQEAYASCAIAVEAITGRRPEVGNGHKPAKQD